MEKIYEQLQELKGQNELVVEINPEVPKTLTLLVFEQNTLKETLEQAIVNQYDLYETKDIRDILYKINELEAERQQLIEGVGRALLGENYRMILNQLGLEFRIDMKAPAVTFFRLGVN